MRLAFAQVKESAEPAAFVWLVESIVLVEFARVKEPTGSLGVVWTEESDGTEEVEMARQGQRPQRVARRVQRRWQNPELKGNGLPVSSPAPAE